MHNGWKQIHEISKCTKDGIISTNTEKKYNKFNIEFKYSKTVWTACQNHSRCLWEALKISYKIRIKTRIPINVLHLISHRKEKGDKLWMYAESMIHIESNLSISLKKTVRSDKQTHQSYSMCIQHVMITIFKSL